MSSDMSTTLPVNEPATPSFAPIRPRPAALATNTSRRRRTAAVVACSLAVVAGLAAGVLAASGHSMIVFAFPAVLLPVAIWKWDEAGVIIVLAVATLVEQVTYTVGPGVAGAFTQKIPLFHSITQGSGVNLFEVLLVMILIVWVMKGALRGSLRLPHSALSRSIGVFLLLVFVGFGVGLSRGGQMRFAIWEVRPFVYLGVMFWLSASLLQTATRAAGGPVDAGARERVQGAPGSQDLYPGPPPDTPTRGDPGARGGVLLRAVHLPDAGSVDLRAAWRPADHRHRAAPRGPAGQPGKFPSHRLGHPGARPRGPDRHRLHDAAPTAATCCDAWGWCC